MPTKPVEGRQQEVGVAHPMLLAAGNRRFDLAEQLLFRFERQLNPVADEVSALTAVVRPILQGVLHALKTEVVGEVGGREQVKLMMLPRLYRRGDGDCGICFEYAVHDAIQRHDSLVMERIVEALSKHCKIPGDNAASILFGAEKTGAVQLIETARERLTDESQLLAGTRGRPVKLKKHIDIVAAAFRKRSVQLLLPHSISGLWKADLFVGFDDSDKWVGTSVKINQQHLEPARGLRVGIVPSTQGTSDSIRRDEQKNLIVCPLPHDGSFMEVFYRAWGIVQQFLFADGEMPKEVSLPMPSDRQVAKYLAERRKFPVVDVINALEPLAQPHLLETSELEVGVILRRPGFGTVGGVIAPFPASGPKS